MNPIIVAHRGASHDAPENTLAAFKLAWEQGADAIEGDFRLTRDQHIVCIHDSTTERFAKHNLTVKDSTLEALKKLDIGSWKDAAFASETVPTLDEVIATIPEDKKFFIEIKVGPEIVEPLVKVLTHSPLKKEQIAVIAFDVDFVAQFKRRMPEVKTHLLEHFKLSPTDNSWVPTQETIFERLHSICADGLSTHCDHFIDAKFIEKLKAQSFEYHTWTVDTLETALHFKQIGARSLTTNKPGWLRAQLGSVK